MKWNPKHWLTINDFKLPKYFLTSGYTYLVFLCGPFNVHEFQNKISVISSYPSMFMSSQTTFQIWRWPFEPQNKPSKVVKMKHWRW
jgi:hypothetical protein